MSNLPTDCDPSTCDDSIRPQDDLYHHVNGGWIAHHQIPADKAMDGSFHRLREESEKQRRTIIDQCVSGDITDGLAPQIARLYRAFMDEDAINAAGLTPLMPLLDRFEGVHDRAQLAQLFGYLSRVADAPIPTAGVGIDPNDPTRYIFMLSQGGLGMPDEAYYRLDEHEPVRQAYLTYLTDLITLIDTNDPHQATATPSQRAQQLVAFEKQVAATHWTNVDIRDTDKTNNPMSWSQVTASCPDFDWEGWARAAHIDTSTLDTVLVGIPPHLEGMSRLWASTPLETLKDWGRVTVVGAFAPMLSEDFVTVHFNFYSRVLAGVQQNRARWKRGVGVVENFLGEPLGQLYVERHFPPDYKQQMQRLVSYLLKAYKQSISHLDWMTDQTKQRALVKLSQFRTKIGYPDTWRDYSSIVFDDDDTIIDMAMQVNAFEHDYQVAKLDQPIDRTEWHMTPQTVNAYYAPTQNEIVFPAAILQPPFFDPQADPAQNFGAIGAVIGHEIGHGFDDQGSKYDGDGKINNWWNDEDTRRFSQLTTSLITYYSQFSPSQLPDTYTVNGALTIGENIGDLGGLTIAYKAWKLYMADQGRHATRDQEQLFFYSWAYIWRTKARDEIAIQLLAIDPHSPAEFRCNGVVSHSDAFAEAFDLHEGDGLWLDPQQRVRIW